MDLVGRLRVKELRRDFRASYRCRARSPRMNHEPQIEWGVVEDLHYVRVLKQARSLTGVSPDRLTTAAPISAAKTCRCRYGRYASPDLRFLCPSQVERSWQTRLPAQAVDHRWQKLARLFGSWLGSTPASHWCSIPSGAVPSKIFPRHRSRSIASHLVTIVDVRTKIRYRAIASAGRRDRPVRGPGQSGAELGRNSSALHLALLMGANRPKETLNWWLRTGSTCRPSAFQKVCADRRTIRSMRLRARLTCIRADQEVAAAV